MSPSNSLSLHITLQAQRLLAELLNCVAESFSASRGLEQTASQILADVEDCRQSRRGDPEAYRRLIERYQEYVGQIMWRFSRDPQVHEELVQDVFVETYLSIGSYRARAPFAHWLSRIATRVGYRYWRQMARQQATESFSLEQWDQLACGTSERIDPSRAAAVLYGLLGQLPPRDRLVLTLRYLEECDVAETARRTGWTKTMVKVQTSRAKKKLEKLLGRRPKEIIS